MATITLGLLQVGTDVVELAIVPAGAVGPLEAQQGNVVCLGEGRDRLAEAVADAFEQGWGRHLVAQMLGQERDHLAADLQVGDVGVEVDAVQAIQVQCHVTVEDIVDVHHTGHGATPVRTASDSFRNDEAYDTGPRWVPGGPRLASLMLLVVMAGPGLLQAALALDVGLQVDDPNQLDRLDGQVAAAEGQRAVFQVGAGDPVAALGQPPEGDRPAVHRDPHLGPGRVRPAVGGGDLIPVLGGVVGRGRGLPPQLIGQAPPALRPHGQHLIPFAVDPDLDPQLRSLLGQRLAVTQAERGGDRSPPPLGPALLPATKLARPGLGSQPAGPRWQAAGWSPHHPRTRWRRRTATPRRRPRRPPATTASRAPAGRRHPAAPRPPPPPGRWPGPGPWCAAAAVSGTARPAPTTIPAGRGRAPRRCRRCSRSRIAGRPAWLAATDRRT